MGQQRVTPDELRRYVGQRVTMHLDPDALGGPTVTGRVTSVLEAADGLVVFVQPDGGAPDTRQSYHSHHVVGIAPA